MTDTLTSVTSLIKCWSIIGALIGSFAFLSQGSTEAPAQKSSSAIQKQKFENATIAFRIASELNSAQISPALKFALIETARPEDLISLKSMLAKYKSSKSTVAMARLGSVVIKDPNGYVKFSIETDPAKSNRYSVNQREWFAPAVGSVLASLDSHLKTEYHARSSAAVKLFFPSAESADNNSDVGKLATYIFVASKFGRPGNTGVNATTYLAGKNVYDALLRGTNFTDGPSMLSSLIGAIKGPITVNCTPEGAKGYALISKTEVAFLAKEDLTVIAKSRGHDQAVAFVPRTLTTEKRAQRAEKSVSAVQPYGDSSSPTDRQHTQALTAMLSILDMCSLRGNYYTKLNGIDFCSDALRLADRTKGAALTKQLLELPGYEKANKDDQYKMKKDLYLKTVTPWLIENRSRAKQYFAEIEKYVIIEDQTGSVQACLNSDCSKTAIDDESFSRGFRIPPNNVDQSVKEALGFKPQQANQPEARIEFACATKNDACESVELVNAAGLNAGDFLRAEGLIERANRSLAWKSNDPSVSQPVSILRALGPCCKDPSCRAEVIERGAELVPTNSSNPSGVAK